MCDNDLVALLNQVYNDFGCHFHSRHLFRKGTENELLDIGYDLVFDDLFVPVLFAFSHILQLSMRYKEGKKAMKSLLGGMASFRLATFLSVLIIPVVSFFRPIFGVGSSITLIFQAFVCARIGMDYCKSDRDKMIAGVMAAVLATQGTAWASAWALAVGFGLNVFLSNWNPLEKNHR